MFQADHPLRCEKGLVSPMLGYALSILMLLAHSGHVQAVHVSPGVSVQESVAVQVHTTPKKTIVTDTFRVEVRNTVTGQEVIVTEKVKNGHVRWVHEKSRTIRRHALPRHPHLRVHRHHHVHRHVHKQTVTITTTDSLTMRD